MPLSTPSNDHDLLVRLDTKLDALSAAFAKVETAVANKADTSRVEKLENQVDGMRSKIYSATGGLAVLQCVIHFLWK